MQVKDRGIQYQSSRFNPIITFSIGVRREEGVCLHE